jgi:small subunit ribosomal protein S3
MIERKFIDESIKKLKTTEHIKKDLEKAGITNIEIQRTTLATRIGVTAEKPGMIIGRKGKTIKDLSESVEKILGIQNPQIEVNEVQNTSLEPAVIAHWIAGSLERGMRPKQILQRAIERIMGAGAMGAEIVVKGKIQGKGAKARKERVIAGYIKKAGNTTRLVRIVKEKAVLKQGIIGITVRIVPPGTVFPDKIDIKSMIQKQAATAAAAEAQKAAEAKPAEAPKVEAKAEEVEIPLEVKESEEEILAKKKLRAEIDEKEKKKKVRKK